MNRMILIGASVAAAAGMVMVVTWLADVAHAAAIVVPLLIFRIGLAFIVPTATAGILSPFPQMAGRAASLLGFLQHGSGAIVVKTIGVWSIASPAPMVIAVAGFSVAALLSYMLIIRRTADPSGVTLPVSE